MIDFSGQTYQAILKAQLDRVTDTIDKREGSIIQTALGPESYALEEFYMVLDQVQQSGFVQTAVGQSLDYLAAIGGISRYPASAAVRLGVFSKDVPIGSRFSTVDGANSINFVVTAAQSEENQYQLTAETPGAIGNSYTGPILPISVIPGLTSAQITDILIPGDDTETDEELRTRLISALNEKPFGGNVADYRQNILAIDGVGAVQVYPVWDGGGTVKCSILGADFMPASPELVESVQKAIDPPPNQGFGYGLAPIGAKVSIAAPESVTVNVSATVTLQSGTSLPQVEPLVKVALENYLLDVRKNWGVSTSSGKTSYSADVYIARVTAAILNAGGVVNVTNVQLNGQGSDLILTETGQTQQVPVLGTVALNE